MAYLSQSEVARIREQLASGAITSAEANMMLDRIESQSNLSQFLPQQASPQRSPTGEKPGHGTMMATILRGMMDQLGPAKVGPPSTDSYQKGRSLGESMRRGY